MMDFIEGLLKSEGYNSILVVVGCLSKYVYFSSFKHPYTLNKITHIFIRDLIRLHEIPAAIVTHHDMIFIFFRTTLFKKPSDEQGHFKLS